MNVNVPPGVTFDINDFYRGNYLLNLLAGQHIVHCDTRLLRSEYVNTEADKVPPPILVKSAELFLNLSEAEESMLVIVYNSYANLNNQFFDNVRNVFVL